MRGVSSMLEPDFEAPYTAWKADPGPKTNAAMLTALKPTIEGAIRTHVGEPNPLLASRARKMALEGLRTYDPKRGRLQTHLYNHLLGLKRVNRQQTTILKVPERVQLDKFHLDNSTKELQAVLGREPTDDELADHMGVSRKRLAYVRSYAPGLAEGTVDSLLGYAPVGVSRPSAPPTGGGPSPWVDLIYDELDPYHKKVMELAMGLNGRRALPNQVIAAKLGRSPGAISQAKARIQALLDQEGELSPFGG